MGWVMDSREHRPRTASIRCARVGGPGLGKKQMVIASVLVCSAQPYLHRAWGLVAPLACLQRSGVGYRTEDCP